MSFGRSRYQPLRSASASFVNWTSDIAYATIAPPPALHCRYVVTDLLARRDPSNGHQTTAAIELVYTDDSITYTPLSIPVRFGRGGTDTIQFRDFEVRYPPGRAIVIKMVFPEWEGYPTYPFDVYVNYFIETVGPTG